MCTVKNSRIQPTCRLKSSHCLFWGFFRQGSGSSITCSQLVLLSIFPGMFPLWQDTAHWIWIVLLYPNVLMSGLSFCRPSFLFNQLAFFHHFLWMTWRREQGNLSKEWRTRKSGAIVIMFVLCIKSNRSPQIRNVFNQNLFYFPSYMFQYLLDESVSHT